MAETNFWEEAFKMRKLFLATLLGSALSASMFAITVDARANIFGSGLASNPVGSPAGSEGTILAPSFSFGAGAGQTGVFTVSGSVLCGADPTFCTSAGGDGQSSVNIPGGTAISSPGNGISGITFIGRQMFLVGVFLTAAPPSAGSTPSTLTFDSTALTAASFGAPAIGQVFFIGDGRVGLNASGGAQQIFSVPTTATRLFVGFADASGFAGTQGMFTDNTGSLAVTFDVSAVPEPATMMLMGLGLAALGLLRRKIA